MQIEVKTQVQTELPTELPTEVPTEAGSGASKAIETPSSTNIVAADSARLLTLQRQYYKEVNKDLQRGSTVSFARHHDSLKSYPLYPYLQYSLISRQLKLSNRQAVDYFFSNFNAVPVARTLRKRWLQLLYSRQRWQLFLSYYEPTTAATAQQCQYQYARYKSGQREAALLDALPLWNVGKSQPSACDPLFKLLIDKDKITEAIAWQRYTQALLNHKFQLARYLERFLVDKTYRDKAAFFLAVDRKPARVGDYTLLGEDSADNRAIIEHGIRHLAKQSATAALKHWARYRQSHHFDEAAQRRVLPQLVKGLHKQGYDTVALAYLNDNMALANSKLLEWQLRTLLRAEKWLVLKEWISALPEPIRREQRWRYWQARAQLMTSSDADVIDRAKTTFRELSRFRSIYGFLSSDRVGNPYRMAENPLLTKASAVDTLANSAAMLRVRELFVQGKNLSARREWYQTSKNFTPEQWLVAAQVAHRQQWHPQAVIAMSQASYWDDIDIRFPRPYRPAFEKHANTLDLPLTLLFAISRQESAFAADVTSPAGARGLMQLMPATAKQVARRHNIRYKSRQQLFEPEKNISLGSRYFKDMMLRFDDNRILSIAAYNAGPHRVASWRKKTAGKLPHDVWVEIIPYSETRQYVQNVLAYALIFAHHLELNQPLLSPAEKQQLL
ncbi:MAG: transglycosylase SLT domain-containing protein [Gammaproteobacteria bacterium]|nr:transglycosylase SLT domain-containing protein [Gammaproteobacteria bacterium]MBQ0840257.1 transglycosylase SLT domain-containing protein [Gammaproteobacteria bacterium]